MSRDLKSVLVIDDEYFIRESFADFFDDNLWKTFQAGNGEEALALLEQESPRGALVDIRMKGMNGDVFIREAFKRYPGLVYVICTGTPLYDVPPDLVKIPQVSNRVFQKPVPSLFELEEELFRLIKQFDEGKIE
ncbi:MAG: response regulator [Anaerolineaceae bacterium]|nr:response regulator [Anaerolineaceae bacterium]